MSRLTVTEKEHWKSRIEHRINRAIEKLQSSNPLVLGDEPTALQAEILAKTVDA